MSRRASLLCGALLCFGATRVALAQPHVDDKTRNAARSLAEQGRDVFDKGDFERAADLFHRAYGLVSAPTIALYEARSLAKLGRLVQAQEAYLRAVRTKLTPESPEAFRSAVHEAEGEELALETRIPKVTLVLSGSGAQLPDVHVSVDGEPLEPELVGVEMPINPGPHVVEASASGGASTSKNFSIAEGAQSRVELSVTAPAATAPEPVKPVVRAPVAPPPASPPHAASWQRPTSYALGALGVAGLGVGIVTGSMAQSRYSEAKSACPNHTCLEGSSGADALSSFRTLRTASTVGYIVGGVGLAAGVTLLVLTPKSEKAASAAVWLAPSGGGVRGAF